MKVKRIPYNARVNPSTISIFRSFRAPLGEAWRHLSRPELLSRWLGTTDIELTPEGTLAIELWNGDKISGTVQSLAPPIRLELQWRPSTLQPESVVTFLLEGDGPGSRLTVRQEGLPTEAEQGAARQMWKDALGALRTTLQEGTDAHEWGSELPVAARATIPRSPSDVWPLLATGAGIEKWVAHVERFEAEPGGAFRLTSRFHGHEIVEEGRVEEIAPESRIALSWEWMGQNWGGSTRVEFSLEPVGGGSSLLIFHSGFDRVAPEARAAARKNYAAAWPEVLAYLKRLVAPVAA